MKTMQFGIICFQGNRTGRPLSFGSSNMNEQAETG
jgi:hypothetical protein